MAVGRSSSLADRVARQYEQQTGRPATPEDPRYAEYVKVALPQLIAADRAALQRSQGRWKTADKFAYAASAIPFAAAVAPAVMGGAGSGGATSATTALPSTTSGIGTTAGYGSLFGGSAPVGVGTAATVPMSVAAPPAAGAGLFKMSDLTRFGIPAGAQLATTYLANRSANKQNALAMSEQGRQFDATQAWLREQDEKDRAAFEATEAEKKRQFDVVEAEKRRRYDEREPYRAFGRGSLVRMNELMDRPTPGRVDYRPTFTYRP